MWMRRTSSGARPCSPLVQEQWSSDITYIRTHEGFLYLAVVIDLFSRRVTGWWMQGRAYTDLPLQALLMAVSRRKPKAQVYVHSDQGSQFTSYAWQEFLEQHNLAPSMSRRANCWDRAIEVAIGSRPMATAVVDSFFNLLKRERIRRKKYTTHEEVRRDVFDYIAFFSNPQHKHDRNGTLSPIAFEQQQNLKLQGVWETRGYLNKEQTLASSRRPLKE
jgi:putative transposase